MRLLFIASRWDPFEKCDMIFNGGVASRLPKTSPAQWGGMDNGWGLSLTQLALGEFDKSIKDFPSIRRFPGGASTDMIPNLQNPANPVLAMHPNAPMSGAPAGD